MNGLQTVAYIGQSAPDYDRHRIFDKRGLYLFLYVNVGDFLRLVGGIIDFVVHKNSNYYVSSRISFEITAYFRFAFLSREIVCTVLLQGSQSIQRFYQSFYVQYL